MHDLTIVFHDAGGGHRSAAGALKTVLEAAVSSLERKPPEPAGTAGPDRFCPPRHRPAHSGWIQPDPEEGLDPADPAVADSFSAHHPTASFAHRAHFAELLGATSDRPGSVRNSAFQSLPGAEHSPGDAERRLRHAAHRSGRLSAELLDRAGIGIHHLRQPARQSSRRWRWVMTGGGFIRPPE